MTTDQKLDHIIWTLTRVRRDLASSDPEAQRMGQLELTRAQACLRELAQ